MSFADYLENKLLDHVFGNAAYTAPATLYIAASTATINDDGTGLTEPVGNAYARVAVTNNATNFPAASGGAKANGIQITFPEASGSWGTISHIAIMDASSGGNVLGKGALAASKAIAAGDTLYIPVGDLDITLD